MAESLFKKVFFSIYSYTIIYALFGVLSLSYHACFNSSLSTLEKRYHFSSSTGGYIMITDNVATVLTNLFIGFYGKTAHKPRWMSIGCVVTGLSVMITALPYFIYGPAQGADLEFAGNLTLARKSKNGDQMCFPDVQVEDCGAMSASKMMTIVAVGFFGVSNFFRGFGTSIYFTYGTPYLDDNVSKDKMPTFFAFIFAARIMGAPIGFYLSSLALKYYENPFSTPAGLVDTDPRWIGAWWIGFLVSGFLLLLLAIPLSLFPREFKRNANVKTKASCEDVQLVDRNAIASGNEKAIERNASEERLDKKDDDHDSEKANKKKDLSLRDMPGEIKKILFNPIIICQMMGNLFRGIGIIGYFVYQTKYLEAQFRQSASKASVVSGTTGFLAKIFGVLFGGLIITFCRPGPRTLTTYIFIVELTSVFTLMYGASVMGPQYIYPQTSLTPTRELNLGNTCNAACHCDYVRYQPVCEHTEMKAYYSPCHAGCRNSYLTIDKSAVYTECSCIDSPTKTLEKCPPDTDRLLKYATIVALGGMISGSSRSGNMVTFFRSINPEEKSLAVAVGGFWHSLFVSIPYPLIYGKIFDYCCLVWSWECGNRGNCWLYDTEKLRIVYHSVSIALIALGSVFDLIMIYLSPRLGKLYDDDEEGSSKTYVQRVTSMFSSSKPKNDAALANGSSEQENRLAITNSSVADDESSGKMGKNAAGLQVTHLQVTKL